MDAGNYLTKVASDPGAGDILMGFLGSVILSFAFSMFKQRKVKKKQHSKHVLFCFRKLVTICLLCLLSSSAREEARS